MALQGTSGMAVAASAAGALLIWSGIKGRSVTTSLKSLISGQPPPAVTAHPVTLAAFTGGSSTGSNTAGVTNMGVSGGPNGQIAGDAMQYDGAGYVWGGAPAKGRGNWDCSSFVNWVVGHDMGMAIPGYAAGKYIGSVHGPTTLQWRFFGKSVSRSQVAAGDIAVWLTHMGIAISNKQMISARDPQEGTGIDNIDGDIPGEPVTFRRL